MKSFPRQLLTALGVAALLPTLALADEASSSSSSATTQANDKTEKAEKKELRVLAAPDHGMRTAVFPRGFAMRVGEAGEKETVTFLGVVTSPVSATLSAQLGLPNGSGLVVGHVDENSPAATALKEHDILLKLDDQQLVDQHQLSVLIRQHKEGDEVTLTYVRGGKQATAKVKLGKHEVPKLAIDLAQPLNAAANAFAWAQNGEGGNAKFELVAPEPGTAVAGAFGGREDVDHILNLIQSRNGEPLRMRIDGAGGVGFRTMAINTGNSTLSYSDDDGSLEITVKDGAKTIVAKNKKGEQVFAGPANTPEERHALPPEVRARLEKVEGMQDMTFHTDGDFQGAETRLLRPLPRGISLPVPRNAPPAPAPLFF